MSPRPECVWDAGALLGEGPLWSPSRRAVYWVDIKNHRLHRYDLTDGARHTHQLDQRISWVAERRGGGLVAGLASGFALLDPDTLEISHIGHPEPDLPDNRFNDAKVDPAGRLWAGTMEDAETRPVGCLYRLDPDFALHCLDRGYTVTNGPAFSPDGHTLYHTDSPARTIYAFDLADDGSLSNKRAFIRFGEGDGYPDGMTVDREGGLWVAHWEGWRVSRFHPDGTLDRSIPLPVARVTSLTFAGEDLDEMFITTASVGMTEAESQEQPLAGGLFRVRPGVRGLPANLFAG